MSEDESLHRGAVSEAEDYLEAFHIDGLEDAFDTGEDIPLWNIQMALRSVTELLQTAQGQYNLLVAQMKMATKLRLGGDNTEQLRQAAKLEEQVKHWAKVRSGLLQIRRNLSSKSDGHQSS